MQEIDINRSTMLGPFPLPAIDDTMRAEAKDTPSNWLAFADPEVPTGIAPPRVTIQGGYEIDGNGELTGRYKINPSYHPSETVTGGFRLTTGLELVLWRVLHGYNPLGLLADSFYHAELLTYAADEQDTTLPLVRDPATGASLFLVGTSSQWVGWQHTNRVEGATVLKLTQQSDFLLDINPGTKLSLRIPARNLAGLITDETPYLKDKYS